MLDFISKFENENIKKINTALIEDMRNESLVDFIVDAYRSLEIIKYIKLLDYEYISDETKFDTDVINRKYLKVRIDKNVRKMMPIDISKFGLLRTRFRLSFKGETKIKTVDLLLPKRHKRYHLLIGGNSFYPIYQLVDSSTYSHNELITLKTLFMPIRIMRKSEKLVNLEGTEFTIPKYLLFVFKKKADPIIYYLALMGLTNTLRYLEIEDIVKISYDKKECLEDDECYTFEIHNGLYIKVIKYFFDNDFYIQSMTASIKNILQSYNVNPKDFDNKTVWSTKLGSVFTTNANSQLERGKGVLLSFFRLLDNTTKKNLKLKSYNKDNIFAVVRWMLRNFSELKAKDNMDLKNKRIRLSEYISYYFVKRLSIKTNALLSRKSITMNDLEDLLNIPQDDLMKQIYKNKSPLLRYDNTTNDNDLFTALKFSSKGPGSLGENNSQEIHIKYRGIHLSHVGRIDINTSGSSDPGLTGMFTPFVKTYGQYFDDSDEPQTWDVNIRKMRANYFNNEEYKIKSLKYFKKKEKKSEKKLKQNIVKRLEDIYSFIENDPYYEEVDNVFEFERNAEINRVVGIKKKRGYGKPKKSKKSSKGKAVDDNSLRKIQINKMSNDDTIRKINIKRL